MNNPAMIYTTTEEWYSVMDMPDWVKRCRTCRSYMSDGHSEPSNGYGIAPGGEKVHTLVCNVGVNCANPERCNPHNRQGRKPKLFVFRETFEEAELRRIKALRSHIRSA